MQTRASRNLLILAIVAGLALQWGTSRAQGGEIPPDGRRYFPQSGHWVMGDFLVTYFSVPNPEQLFGYPITDEYQEQLHGKVVQYFERARFELQPDGPEELRVTFSPLGRYMYEAGTPLELPANFPPCKRFIETSFQVCYAFLDFFEANGGVSQFGFPISNFEIYEQRIVQHFQRARFEWHPELPPGERVTLAPLGRLYFIKLGEDPRLTEPNPDLSTGSDLTQLVLNLRVRAFPQAAVLSQSGTQAIHVMVQDQNNLPLSNASIELTIVMPSKYRETITLQGVTDQNGMINYQYSYRDEPVGVAEIYVTARYENFTGHTVTAFRIWW